MKKQRAVIWGTGSGYRKRQKAIKEKYEIAAYTDNSGNSRGFSNYISPEELAAFSFDVIVICSKPYYLTIKYQLMQKYHIEEAKICSIEDMKEDLLAEAEEAVISHIAVYNSANKRKEFAINDTNLWLIGSDYNASAGKPLEHYFAQDIWAAARIHEALPEKHYDIGSRLDGFLAHLLVFCRDITYIDIRPLPFEIPGLHFVRGDATNLEGIEDASIESLSSLHAIEHFGLGRYGDPIDPEACFKVMKAFQRVLKPDGKLYLGVPLASENKLIFNAHRLFHPRTIIESFDKMELVDFRIVYSDSYCATIVEIEDIDRKCSSIPDYTCGLFEFIKK